MSPDAANPPLPLENPLDLPFASCFNLAPSTPFLGARGMIPACPKSLATVSDGCAPTDNQYLSGRSKSQSVVASNSASRGEWWSLRGEHAGESLDGKNVGCIHARP